MRTKLYGYLVSGHLCEGLLELLGDGLELLLLGHQLVLQPVNLHAAPRGPMHSPSPGRGGDKVDCGCRTGPSDSGYIGWRTGTTTLCHSRLNPQVWDYEFGYSSH
jgi:hypothetical protein